MTALSMLAAAGVWPGLPATGYLLFARTQRAIFPPLTSYALLAVAGIAVWSLPLLAAAVAGVYRPEYFGLMGWVITAVALALLFRSPALNEALTTWRTAEPARAPKETQKQEPSRTTQRTGRKAAGSSRQSGPAPAAPTWSADTIWNWILAAGLVLAALLYLAFPGESIYGGRDEGVYSTHAVYMAHHGTLNVPYPWPADVGKMFSDVWIGFPGFYKTANVMTPQFGHLFAVWLAQAFATLGAGGLFRLNALFAWLSVAVFYGLCRMVVPKSYAVVATLFFALNPGQLWMARITLSEILTQLFTWSGLLLLLQALKDGQQALARWAGVCLGLSAFVRFDSLLLMPLILLGHAAFVIVGLQPSRADREHAQTEPAAQTLQEGLSIWPAFYQTGVPMFALAFEYYWVFSHPYVAERPYMGKLQIAILLSLLVLFVTIAGSGAAASLWRTVRRIGLAAFAASLGSCLWFGSPPSFLYFAYHPYIGTLAVSLIVAGLASILIVTRITRLARPVLTSVGFLAGVGIAVVAVTAYAYWIRPLPSSAPHLSYRWPGYYGDDMHDYSKDTLVDLAQYLSLPGTWAAIAGWLVTLWMALRRGSNRYLIVGLVIIAGSTVVYLQQTFNSADHIWAVRRFIPVIIPGFILCTVLGLAWLLAQLPQRWSPAVAALVLVFLCGFTTWSNRLIAVFAENAGYYSEIHQLAENLPRDQLIVARGFTEFLTPLYIAFDRHVVPLNLDAGSKARDALYAWVAKQSSEHKPAYLLLEGQADLRGLQVRQLYETVVTRTYSEPTVNPLPTKTISKQRRVRLYEVTSAGAS